MSLWVPAPPPPSKLGRYRVLSPNCGLHVSPLQLGAMSIGDKWEAYGMGAMNKEASFKLLDAYYEKGGNFIDTANNYQDESSEEIIGEWMESRGNRDEIVVATKYTTGYKRADPNTKIKINFAGNNVKSMHLSVEASLKKLRTSYIDIFYLHWWDYETSIEEAMTALHNLVIQGKVLYLGISDTPAWVVSRANQFARDHGKTPFSIYQGAWNVMERSFERDIIPMARAEGLALAPWNVLAAGKLRTDAEEQRRRETGEKGRMLVGPNWERSPDEVKMSRALEKVAKEVGAKHITSVAIAYLMHKTPYVFPIIGGRKVEHFYANMEALDITISDEQIKELESVIPFDPGFPNTMVVSIAYLHKIFCRVTCLLQGDGAEFPIFFKNAGLIDKQPRVQPIRPGKE
ncbi:putative aryl-alcohol dehydrogenase aad14 [Pleurotus ostreatus]|nr:putative aryl-alcohol dehydrogenase aad14 [Pleurotus ostreatus]